jgi:pimeloyl-ACP methyl ester carboxylesterase
VLDGASAAHQFAHSRPGEDLTEDIVSIRSFRLSHFWKKTIALRARIVAPRRMDRSKPTALLFHVPGFGGDFLAHDAAYVFPRSDSTAAQLVNVVVDPSFETGHHSLVNSDSNGPWGEAFVRELVPAIEDRLHLDRYSTPLYLTGHSTGGWSVVYLLVTYPDVFAGVWATAPDPLDFRDFFGINVTPGSTDNVYYQKNGSPIWLARGSSRTLRADILESEAEDETSCEFRVDEWKWSHALTDHVPARLFDRKSGRLNPDTLRSWSRFDLRRLVETLEPEQLKELAGKLHLVCGEEDTYFLDRPTRSFCKTLDRLDVGHDCIFVDGRDHFNLYEPAREYPDGLSEFIVDNISKEVSRPAAH